MIRNLYDAVDRGSTVALFVLSLPITFGCIACIWALAWAAEVLR